MADAFIGIDPGKDGALVVLPDEDDGKVKGYITPVGPASGGGGREYLASAMAEIMAGVCKEYDVRLVAIERGLARRRGRNAGATSIYATGYGVALWVGMAAMSFVPYVEVPPFEWHSQITTSWPGGTKERAIACVRRVLPCLELAPGDRRVPHTGLADAACLAMYAQQVHHRHMKLREGR